MADSKPEFDPSKAFTTAEATAKPAFDPNQNFVPGQPGVQSIGSPSGQPSTFDQNHPTIAKVRDATINSLPTVGAAIGGIAATPESFGTATIPGAMAGGAAGVAAKKLLEGVRDRGWDYFKGTPTVQGTVDAAKDLGMGAVYGGLQEVGGQVANKALGMAAEAAAPYTPQAVKNIPAVLKAAYAKMTGKVGSALTGVPETEIVTQLTRPDEVKAVTDAAKQELDSRLGNSVTEAEKKKLLDPQAAQTQQENIFNDVQDFKKAQNQSITDALTKSKVADKPATIDYQLGNAQGVPASAPAGTVPLKPVLDALDQGAARINPKLDPGGAAEVQALRDKVESMASGQGGVVDMNELNQVRMHLQNVAEAAFQNSKLGFTVGDATAQTAKKGWGAAKELMDQYGPAEIKAANANLSKLHGIEDTLNKNLVTPGATSSPLLAVGSGETAGAAGTNRLALADLGKLTGNDYIGQAENLSAAQRFRNPGILPNDTTGKGMVRLAVGAGAGKAASAATGIPGLEYAGAALTSPLSLKLGLALQNQGGNVAKSLLQPGPQGALMRYIYQNQNSQGEQ